MQTISRRCPVECLARAAVQLCRYRVEVLTGMDREVGALWEVLPQQAVGVLVRATLPGAGRKSRRDVMGGVTRCFTVVGQVW